MKTRIISKMLFIFGLVFVLGSAITQVRGQGVVSIHSTGDVTRGETGSFVLTMNANPPYPWYWLVNFSVSGTAIPGMDFGALISPAFVYVHAGCPPPYPQHCGPAIYGVIPVTTLPDPRGSFFPQPYSVVVTLKPGFGYTIGQPSSTQLMINP